jgi:secondary thiamine-phosphate synthase enzyme
MKRKAMIGVESRERLELIDVTDQVRRYAAESGVADGWLLLYVPHTTAAVTINENADPDVRKDMTGFLDGLVPDADWFRHAEGNSSAHIMSSLVGVSQTLIVENGQLQLGTWQGIYFCEFDGPRRRQLHLSLLPA